MWMGGGQLVYLIAIQYLTSHGQTMRDQGSLTPVETVLIRFGKKFTIIFILGAMEKNN